MFSIGIVAVFDQGRDRLAGQNGSRWAAQKACKTEKTGKAWMCPDGVACLR